MPKRKRTQTDEGRDSEDSVKKRKKSLNYDPVQLCQELYETVRSFKVDDGRNLCESFIRAPKRRNSADYYDIVTNPIDMLKIQQKLKTDEYEDIDQMTLDIELMVNNAKMYYKKSSQEYKDACQLWDLYIDNKNTLLNEANSNAKKEHQDDSLDGGSDAESYDRNEVLKNVVAQDSSGVPHTPHPLEEENPFEELFAAVMTAIDSDGRVLSSMFQLLPSRRRYPEYYKVIQEPIDLKMIATKIQNKEYESLSDLERDLLLIVKNARLFNEPGSPIYKDAMSLRKVISNKKMEIEHGRVVPAKTSERIRAKRLAGGQHLSSITAALQYESDPDDVEEEEDDDEDNVDPEESDSPHWQLYDTVRNFQNSQGYQLSEPFLRLPSRRVYPDYYKEIRNPISLYNIRSKIKTGQYESISDTVDDMNLMFENAKHYNRADSRIYKDAVKLQKIMQTKARELISLEKDSESDDDSVDEKSPRRKYKKSEDKKRLRRSAEPDSLAKRKMRILYKTLVDYLDETGRPLITMFMEKPSRKDYPDYYQVITDPIDMKIIDANIKTDKYPTEDALVSDFKLMFNNCRQYNEEESLIYHDADCLESVLLAKVRELEVKGCKTPGRKKKLSPQLSHKLRTLYDTVKDYTDNKSRKLSLIFMKLPTKNDYPDYYEVIKKPIDMNKIHSKLQTNQYDNLEDLLSDFVLMFDNACKYNEPDSQIYKDALTLQRIALQTKVELSESEEGGVPDIRALVQEMLTSLFISVYNHQDEEGRCYSDSLVELYEATENMEGEKMLNLDMIKRNLDKGRYRRMDHFQEDMFEVFERARRLSRTDSQVFEDSAELQSYFIKLRDKLCKNGDVLQTRALNYSEKDLQVSVENMKHEKVPREKKEDEKEKEQDNRYDKNQEHRTNQHNSESVNYREQTYHVGDFVYIEPREKGLDPHIIHIDKLWKDDQGEHWLYGCWFYRPNETFHLATRKFLEKEVFKSDNFNSTRMSQVLGKCHVMFVKDYFKYKPEGFLDKDVYVCESRYSAKAKAFKKIKVWAVIPTNASKYVLREEPLTPVRVPSVFKERLERVKEESSDLDEYDCKMVEREKPNIDLPSQSADEGIMYYEQYNIPAGCFKLGDCVYVRSENGKQLIARIDKMWMDKSGGYFHGPWFVTPAEIPHPPTRMFYKHEVFLSSIEDTNPLLSITGRCCVLELKDYMRCRPTEVPEQDIYVCESRYMEAERQIRKLVKGLKKYNLSAKATPDETYFFRKPLNPPKNEYSAGSVHQGSRSKHQSYPEPSPLLPKVLSDVEMEDSNDGHAPSVGSTDAPSHTPSVSATGKKKPLRRLVTGYILFASEVRKSFIAQNPESTFGEISRIVGTEWRSLPPSQKTEYEERAQKMNEETAAKEAAAAESVPQSPAGPENTIYECLWDNCDFQFEDQQDLVDHLIQEPNGHVQRSYQNTQVKETENGEQPKGEFQCMWHGCSRIRKNIPPFPNLQRLVRHCKEVHIKASGKNLSTSDRSKNFFPSRNSSLMSPGSSRPLTPAGQYIGNIAGYPAQGYASMLSGYPNQQYGSSMMAMQSGVQLHYLGQAFKPRNFIFQPPALLGQRLMLMPYSVSPLPLFAFGIPLHPIPAPTILAPATAYSRGQFTGGTSSSKPADPLFVLPPPKPQRLLHSEAYIRYIEGLQADNKTISNWDVHLRATPENTSLNESGRLPVHWLGNGVGNHGNVVNALWALRDFMMKDAFNIAKVLW